MPVKLLKCTCSTCKRNKSHIVSGQTIQAEVLGDFFKHIGCKECWEENIK